MRVFLLASLVLLPNVAPVAPVGALSGGLNGEGCHNDRKNGGYHCYRGSAAGRSSVVRRAASTSGATYFSDCRAARAAGGAPVRAGEPGYSDKLDRDGDGVGCE
jgi:hypothetical protein